ARPNIWRPEERARMRADQHLLNARLGGDPHSDVAVVVMIVHEHRERFPPSEEGRRAVRQALFHVAKCRADGADAFQVLFSLRQFHFRSRVISRAVMNTGSISTGMCSSFASARATSGRTTPSVSSIFLAPA